MNYERKTEDCCSLSDMLLMDDLDDGTDEASPSESTERSQQIEFFGSQKLSS
jgi:hypothetical protein